MRDEIVKLYPNFRYLRIQDIIAEIKTNNETPTKISGMKNELKKLDFFLENMLPRDLYEILSYQSKNSSINPNITRSKDIYTFSKNNRYKKPKALLFSHPKINKENFIKEEELYNYLKKKIIIKKRLSFNIKDDEWFIYLLH